MMLQLVVRLLRPPIRADVEHDRRPLVADNPLDRRPGLPGLQFALVAEGDLPIRQAGEERLVVVAQRSAVPEEEDLFGQVRVSRPAEAVLDRPLFLGGLGVVEGIGIMGMR